MVKYDNIPGFPGYYISKRGGLWSNRKNGQWKKLKPHLNKMWNRYQCTLGDSRGIRKLLKEAMGMDKATKGVTVIIK